MTRPDSIADVRRYVAMRRQLGAEFKETLIEALQLDLEPSEIGLDTPLFGSGLGLDSVDALSIAASVEQRFGLQVLDTDIGNFRSVNSVIDFILRVREEGQPRDAAAEAVGGSLTYDVSPDHPYARVRDDLGLFGFSATEKVRVAGPGAFEFLDRELASNLQDLAIGDIAHTLLLHDDGTIAALVWLMRRENDWWLIGEGESTSRLCDELMARGPGSGVTLTDITAEFGMLALVGPRAQEVVSELFDAELLRLSYGEFVTRECRGQPVLVARYGETGEFEYRLVIPAAAVASLREFITEAVDIELIPPAWYDVLALEMKSMRRATLPDGPCRPGCVDLHWMLYLRKNEFRGREGAIDSLTSSDPRAILLEFDGDGLAPNSPVRIEDAVVGRVRFSARSHRLGTGIALCYIDDEYAFPGITFHVGDGGGIPALSRSAPLFLTKTVVDNLNM